MAEHRREGKILSHFINRSKHAKHSRASGDLCCSFGIENPFHRSSNYTCPGLDGKSERAGYFRKVSQRFKNHGIPLKPGWSSSSALDFWKRQPVIALEKWKIIFLLPWIFGNYYLFLPWIFGKQIHFNYGKCERRF